MKAYWEPNTLNVGDTLTPHLLSFLLPNNQFELASPLERGKLCGVGSVLEWLPSDNDVIWGGGFMYGWSKAPDAKNCNVLLLRGPLSERILTAAGWRCPEIFGDPGILLGLMYKPSFEKKFKVGCIPHILEYERFRLFPRPSQETLIDVRKPWRLIMDEIASCEKIISSSLHGLVIAESLGVPATWSVWSNRVEGDGFKFRDYFAGTGRSVVKPGVLPVIDGLSEIQGGISNALTNWARNSH